MNQDKTFLEQLSDDQKSILYQFRCQLKDFIEPSTDDYFLWRWLKARKFNIEKAEKMLREHMKFRKNIGMNNILSYQQPEVVEKYLSYNLIGFDKEGDVIMACLTGIMDLKGMFSSLNLMNQIKTFVYYMESALNQMQMENQKTGKNGRRMILIHDLRGLKLRQLMDRTVGKRLIELFLMFEANYPETLKCLYIINAPSFFYAWFNVLKQFTDAEVIRKVKVYAKGGWEEDMLQMISPEVLPAIFGGHRTDPDGNPNCYTLFNRDTKIPTSYYLAENSNQVKDPSLKRTVVSQRIYFNHLVDIKQQNSIIRWYFQTLDFDIGFAVYHVRNGVKPVPLKAKHSHPSRRKNFKDEVDILVPLERVESHLIPEQGEVLCQATGTYFLQFDNTHSWMTPKELYYKVEVLPPTESVLGLDESNKMIGTLNLSENS